MAVSTFENPIITCTEHQLAWSAWQTAQGTPPEQQQDHDDSDNRKAFVAWWELGVSGPAGVGLNGQSILLTCLDAWMRGGALGHIAPAVSFAAFLPWWAPIVAEGAAFNT